MTKLRTPTFAAILLGLAMSANGCVIGDCENPDGTKKENCISLTPATIWEHHEQVVQTVDYTSGMPLKVEGVNGKITIVVGGLANKVEAKFDRFTLGDGDAGDAAKDEMETKLELTTIVTSNTVVVTSKRLAGATAGLGADITVSVPPSFFGGVTVANNNGSTDIDLRSVELDYTTIEVDGRLDLKGAGGQLNINIGSLLDSTIHVQHWAVETSLIVVQGDVLVTVGTGLGGSIQATSDSGVISDPNPLPSDWTASPENQENAKSYSFGDATGGVLTIQAGQDITLAVGSG